jgi:hypothetical protein
MSGVLKGKNYVYHVHSCFSSSSPSSCHKAEVFSECIKVVRKGLSWTSGYVDMMTDDG